MKLNGFDKETIIEKYTRFLRLKKVSPNSIKAYALDAEQFLDFIESHKSEIVVGSLTDFAEFLRSSFLSENSVKRKIRTSKKFISYLVQNSYINLESGLSKVKFEKTEEVINFLSYEELSRLRHFASADSRLYAMLELILQTGCKISEISNLKLDAVNKDVIKFSSREVNMNRKLMFTMDEYKKEYHSKESSGKAFFYTSNNKKINVRNIRGYFDELFRKSDMLKYNVNSLRNTFIICQLNAGVDMSYLADVVGNKSIMSIRRYLPFLQHEYSNKWIKTVLEV